MPAETIMRRLKRFSEEGFTLVEVTVFLAIITVFFVVVLQASTNTLTTLKTTERRMYATRYAEELTEWVSGEKDNDWDNTFLPKAPLPVNTVTTYCFNGTISAWPAAGSCGGYTLGGLYKRELQLSRQSNATPGDYQVTAVVTVSWQQGSGTYSVPIQTIFNKNE